MDGDSPSHEELQARLARAEAELSNLRPVAHPAAAQQGPASALESISEGFVILDHDGRFAFVNSAAERFLQKSRAELIGQRPWELFPEAGSRRFGLEYRRAVAENVPVHFEEFYPEPLNAWYEARAYPSAEGLSVFFRDITDRKRVEQELERALSEAVTEKQHLEVVTHALSESEAALQRAHDALAATNEALRHSNETLEARVATRTATLAHRTSQLRALAREVTRAEERERQKISEVIHDQLQQLLSVARIKLGLALGQVGTRSHQEDLSEVDDLIAESLDITRTLTAELSPAILRRSGLAAALGWLGRWYEARFAITVAVEAEDDVDVEEELRVTLFRSVRELLFNVVKHAGVTGARVQLERGADGRVRILVSDDGVGFDPEAVRAREGTGGGFGLFNLRERLELLGGQFEVDSAPGRGASFTMFAPLPQPAGPEVPAPEAASTAPLAIAVRRHTGARHRPARRKKGPV
jgi:PAS domain S-box-containing protein